MPVRPRSSPDSHPSSRIQPRTVDDWGSNGRRPEAARPRLLPMTPAVVATAHQLRGTLDGDPGDRVIVATALVEGVKLVTKDERITESGIVPVVW